VNHRTLTLLTVAMLGSCVKCPTLPELVVQGRERWMGAICRDPGEVQFKLVIAPLKCRDVENAYGCNLGNGTVLISSETPSDVMGDVVLHELGHSVHGNRVFGTKDHVDPHQGIMVAAMDDRIPRITGADVQLVCSIRPCPCENPE
jgi:hypothetical protein